MPAFDYPDPGLTADLLFSMQLCLGVLFAAAAGPKLAHPARFRETVADFAVFPTLAPFVAWLTIAGELAVAVSFLSSTFVAVGIALAMLLTLMFAVATGLNLYRGRKIDCGCFGGESEEISAKSLIRLGFIGAGTVALAAGYSVGGIDPIQAKELMEHGFDGVAFLIAAFGTAAGILAGAALIINSDELLDAVRGKETAQ